jgi:hypothetical protein
MLESESLVLRLARKICKLDAQVKRLTAELDKFRYAARITTAELMAMGNRTACLMHGLARIDTSRTRLRAKAIAGEQARDQLQRLEESFRLRRSTENQTEVEDQPHWQPLQSTRTRSSGDAKPRLAEANIQTEIETSPVSRTQMTQTEMEVKPLLAVMSTQTDLGVTSPPARRDARVGTEVRRRLSQDTTESEMTVRPLPTARDGTEVETPDRQILSGQAFG